MAVLPAPKPFEADQGIQSEPVRSPCHLGGIRTITRAYLLKGGEPSRASRMKCTSMGKVGSGAITHSHLSLSPNGRKSNSVNEWLDFPANCEGGVILNYEVQI